MKQSAQELRLFQRSITYKNQCSLLFRIITICLGSFCIGFTLVYYYTMTQWYCQKQFGDQNICQKKSGQPYFKSWKYLMIGAILPISSAFGSLLIGYILKKYCSRRAILIISSGIGVFGCALSIVSFQINKDPNIIFNYAWFIVGRIFRGFAVGLNMVFCLVIINQYSPSQLKLRTIGIYQISIQLGELCCKVIFPCLAYQFLENNTLTWSSVNTIILSILIGIFLIQALLLLFVYKEQPPLYLLKHDKQQQARQIINTIYDQEFATEKLIQIKQQAKIDSGSFYDNFDKISIQKKTVFLGIYAITVQQLSGINFVNAFGFYFPDQASSISQKQTIPYDKIFLNVLPNVCQLFGTITLLIINWMFKKSCCRSRRKTYIKIGTIMSCVIMGVILILEILQKYDLLSQQNSHSQFYWLILQCAYMFAFGLTLGSMTWVYLSQMLKAFQLQIIISVHWLLATLNMFTFYLPRKKQSTHWVVPAILFICCFVFSFLNKYYLIQTKNKTTLEIIRKINTFNYLPWKKNI